MSNRSKQVAIAYDLDFRHAAAIFSGAADYVREAGLGWDLLPLNYGFETKLMELVKSGRLDGAIGAFVSDEWLTGLLLRDVAAVNLSNFSRIRSVPSVSVDDEALGRAAARHLRKQGARSFSFIGRDEAHFSWLRRGGFQKECPDRTFHSVVTGLSIAELMDMLEKWPQPTGILCGSDRIAGEICAEARLRGIICGRDLLLVGVGNEPSESIFAGLGLSSFEIPAQAIGAEAARLMRSQLADHDAAAQPESVALAAELIPRESSLPSPRARLAERAVKAIEESIADPLFEVNSLARRLGASRRLLELTLRQYYDQSPFQMLSKQRLARAKQLLLSTQAPVAEIGKRCGYPEPHHFSAWFKKHTSLAPRKFRATGGDLQTSQKAKT